MSHVRIKRYERDVAITLHSTTSLATTLRLDDMAGGAVSFGTMSTNAATLQTWGSVLGWAGAQSVAGRSVLHRHADFPNRTGA